MEKRKPHCPLYRVQELVNQGRVRATRVAYDGARKIGVLSLAEMCDIIVRLEMRCFYKSMTTYAKSDVWQDVYHTSTSYGVAIYVKLTVVDDLLIVSFKELGS